MQQIIKEKLNDFLNYYHYFHDSYITSVNYDVEKRQIKVLINVYWSGEPTLKDDNSYETNKTKIEIVFNRVFDCSIKYIDLDIQSVYMEFLKIEGKEYICFADSEDSPSFYVISESAEYKNEEE